ncbi:Protease inhibitor epi9, partial [Globisporangium splendens]
MILTAMAVRCLVTMRLLLFFAVVCLLCGGALSSVRDESSNGAGDRKCDLECGTHWSPICASDGVTYRNACKLEEAYCEDHNVRSLYNGECQEELLRV